MNVNPVNNNQSFEGKVILKNKISTQQNYLFNLHRQALDKMIKDMPFDLFVEQSKSKKTITLSTNVEGASSYFVRKNKQDFESAAGYAISDAMKKSEVYQKMVKAKEMTNYIQLEWFNLSSGKYKEAREAHKQLAKLGLANFDIYKSLINCRFTGFPSDVNKMLIKNIIKYKIYSLFTSKTTEEKQLIKMYKAYRTEMKAQNKEIKPVIIDFSQAYYGLT